MPPEGVVVFLPSTRISQRQHSNEEKWDNSVFVEACTMNDLIPSHAFPVSHMEGWQAVQSAVRQGQTVEGHCIPENLYWTIQR